MIENIIGKIVTYSLVFSVVVLTISVLLIVPALLFLIIKLILSI